MATYNTIMGDGGRPLFKRPNVGDPLLQERYAQWLAQQNSERPLTFQSMAEFYDYRDRNNVDNSKPPAGGDGGGGGVPAAPAPAMPQADTFSLGGYNPGSYGVTQGQIGNAPTYNSQWDDELQSIYNRIMNREDFSFDLNGNALYNQYKDQYMNQGKLAMQDTMGQAAALTGGYGSSYGQQVGQQQYDAYLQQLNNVVPEIYGMERDQYNQEGQDLLNQYSMTSGLKNDEYGQYRDATSDYRADRDYLSGQEQLQYNRGYQQYQDQQSQQDENYNKLLQLMTTTGFEPTEGDLAAAGMSAYEAGKWKEYIAKQNAPRSGGGPVEKPLKTPDREMKAEGLAAYNKGGAQALAQFIDLYADSGYDLEKLEDYAIEYGTYTATQAETQGLVTAQREDELRKKYPWRY